MKVRVLRDLNYRGKVIGKGTTAEVDNHLGAKWISREWAEEAGKVTKKKAAKKKAPETASVDKGETATMPKGKAHKVK